VSKYHAQKETVDGITFASRKEAKRYRELKLLERANAITDLKLQVPFPLIHKSKYGREVKYIADFVYTEDGKTVVEDTKGYRTDVYKIKRRLMQELYSITIKET
jgi:hypothetical protein